MDTKYPLELDFGLVVTVTVPDAMHASLWQPGRRALVIGSLILTELKMVFSLQDEKKGKSAHVCCQGRKELCIRGRLGSTKQIELADGAGCQRTQWIANVVSLSLGHEEGNSGGVAGGNGGWTPAGEDQSGRRSRRRIGTNCTMALNGKGLMTGALSAAPEDENGADASSEPR